MSDHPHPRGQLSDPEGPMVDSAADVRGDLSLYALGTALIRNRWRVAVFALVGALLAALAVATKPRLYTATTSFVPEGSDGGQSGLAGLASQFGVAVPTSNHSLSPEFYQRLVKSRVVLLPIVYDTLTVAELGGKQMTFMQLMDIEGGTAAAREEMAINNLSGMISPGIAKNIGVVEVSVASRWRSTSLQIADALIKNIIEYNQATRQGQAVSERKFVEGRLSIATSDLRAAEDRVQTFERRNRAGVEGSPELRIDRDRIQRDLSLKQQIFTSLTSAYEDARVREVRDMPSITVFEQPWAPLAPQARGRVRSVILGGLAGALVAVVLIFLRETVTRRSRSDDEAEEFMATLGQVKGKVVGKMRALRVQRRSTDIS